MSLQTEIEAEALTHDVGFYVVFAGIETRLATSDPGDGGTYIVGMNQPTTSAQNLDRRQGVVRPGGFSVDIAEKPDNSLGAYFARRGGTEIALPSSLDASTTTVLMNTSLGGAFANGATVYVGRETITLGTYTASPSPRYTGCTRGAHGSVAEEHQKGRTMSTKPRHFKGRFATLYEFNHDTGTAGAIRTGVLDVSPKWNRGLWSLSFLDVTTSLNRPICTGWQEEQVQDVTFNDDGTATVQVEDASLFVADSWVRISADERQFHHRLTAIDTVSDPNTLTVDVTQWRSAGENLDDTVPLSDATIRQVVVMRREDPARAALRILLSRYGDGANNATYDNLPGIAPDGGDGTQAAKRMGASIPATYVDVDAWTACIGVAQRATFVLDEQMHAIDFIAREIAWRLGGFVHADASGALSFRRYLPATVDATLPVYDESDLASADIQFSDDEEEVMAGVVVEGNYDYSAREYRRRTEIVFPETQDVYGEERDLHRISSRSLRIGDNSASPLASPALGESDIAVAMLRTYARTYLGLRRVRIAVRWQWHLRFYVGYRFKLTLASVPDGSGGEGVSEVICEVVSNNGATDVGHVVIEVDFVPTGKIIAPRMQVSSTASSTVYLAGRTDLEPEPDTLKQFPTSCVVRFYDASASPPFSVTEIQTVVANPAAGQIEVDALPSSFTLAAGDHCALVYGSGNTGNTNDLGADVNDHAILADANDEVDGDRANAGRWQ